MDEGTGNRYRQWEHGFDQAVFRVVGAGARWAYDPSASTDAAQKASMKKAGEKVGRNHVIPYKTGVTSVA